MLRRATTAELLPPDPPQHDRERRQLEHTLPEFQVVREVGGGASGVVFLARDLVLHRLVAIKVLRGELADSDEHHARFLTEAQLTARLSDLNIVPIHQFGRIGELSYTVMKFVDGVSLAVSLACSGKLAPNEAARVLRDLARAVHSAHGEGVVHRDLKPDNVIIERSRSGAPGGDAVRRRCRHVCSGDVVERNGRGAGARRNRAAWLRHHRASNRAARRRMK